MESNHLDSTDLDRVRSVPAAREAGAAGVGVFHNALFHILLRLYRCRQERTVAVQCPFYVFTQPRSWFH